MNGKLGLIGAIVGAVLSWFLGYLQPGLVVGSGGTTVHGGAAAIGLSGLMSLIVSFLGSVQFKKILALLGVKAVGSDPVPGWHDHSQYGQQLHQPSCSAIIHHPP